MDKELSRRTRYMLNAVSLAQAVPLTYVTLVVLDLNPVQDYAVGALIVGLVYLELGLFERWLRKKVKQRALEGASVDESAALPESPLGDGTQAT